MQVIKSTKKVDNAKVGSRYTMYLSQHEFRCLCAALQDLCVPILDQVEEEHRKFFFDRFSAPCQKTLMFLSSDLSSLV